MKYSKEDSLAIGKEVHEGLITVPEAVVKYSVSDTTITRYLAAYKDSVGIPIDKAKKSKSNKISTLVTNYGLDISDYQDMSKEELIDELIKAKVNEARAKKGYEVKGGGESKEYVSLNSRNSK